MAAKRLMSFGMHQQQLPFMERIHVLGGGSIGLLFAASIRSAFPSYPLTMLLRPHHEPRLSAADGGLSKYHMDVCLVQNKRPKIVRLPARIVSPNQGKMIRNLLLATKAPDALCAIKSVMNRIPMDGDARIIILCNGALAIQEEIEEELLRNGKNKCVLTLASTTHGAFRDDDDDDDDLYRVTHAGIGRTFVEEDEPLTRLFDQTGLVASSVSRSDMNVLLWQKLAANCTVNPLSALLDCTNGQLANESMFDDLTPQIIHEISAIATASSGMVVLQPDELETFVRVVMDETKDNISSMRQDVIGKRKTEIEYLNGYVVKKGQELGIETPANSHIQSLILQLAG